MNNEGLIQMNKGEAIRLAFSLKFKIEPGKMLWLFSSKGNNNCTIPLDQEFDKENKILFPWAFNVPWLSEYNNKWCMVKIQKTNSEKKPYEVSLQFMSKQNATESDGWRKECGGWWNESRISELKD
jgi:hypothetical protein